VTIPSAALSDSAVVSAAALGSAADFSVGSAWLVALAFSFFSTAGAAPSFEGGAVWALSPDMVDWLDTYVADVECDDGGWSRGEWRCDVR